MKYYRGLKKHFTNRWPSNYHEFFGVTPFYNIHDEIRLIEDILFKRERIFAHKVNAKKSIINTEEC